jgi:DNA repair exonuclease SbcCD nuclease subunit
MPIRLMHFGDVHFGVENYGRFDPLTGLPSRLVDFRNALLSAIEIALSAGVKLAVFAGDSCKTRDPNQTHQREFASCLSKLTSAGCRWCCWQGATEISINWLKFFGVRVLVKIHIMNILVINTIIMARDIWVKRHLTIKNPMKTPHTW